MEKLHLDYMRQAFNAFFLFKINQDAQTCARCKTKFSAYFCSMCKHFTGTDKNPFHCTKCGICRQVKRYSLRNCSFFHLLDDVLVFQKCKGVFGLLRYQVLPYEWKEKSGVSLRARATLNKRDTSCDRYAHEIYHCHFISPPSLRNRIKKVLSTTEYQFLLPHRNQDSILQIESSRNIGFSLCIRNLISLRFMLSFARVLPAK